MRVTGVDTKTKFTFQKSGLNHGVVSQAARGLSKCSVLNLNPKVYSRFLSALAARSEVVANRLKALGLPEKVTPAILVEKCGSVFTSNGLTETCAHLISQVCQKADLSPAKTKVFKFLRQKFDEKPGILSVLQLPDDILNAKSRKRFAQSTEVSAGISAELARTADVSEEVMKGISAEFKRANADASEKVMTGTEREIREAQVKLVEEQPFTEAQLLIRQAEAKRCAPPEEKLAAIAEHSREAETSIRAFFAKMGIKMDW